MQNKQNKCDKCVKLQNFIDENLPKVESIFDLILDVAEFKRTCECEEKRNESEEYDN